MNKKLNKQFKECGFSIGDCVKLKGKAGTRLMLIENFNLNDITDTLLEANCIYECNNEIEHSWIKVINLEIV